MANIFTKDKELVSVNESIYGGKLIYNPIVASLCASDQYVIGDDEVYGVTHRTETYELTTNVDDNIDHLTTPSTNVFSEQHAHARSFFYVPTVRRTLYATNSTKQSEMLTKELETVNAGTIDQLNESLDIEVFLGGARANGVNRAKDGFRSNQNTVLDESHSAGDLKFDLIKSIIRDKIRAIKQVAQVRSTDLATIDCVFSSEFSDIIYDESLTGQSNSATLASLFPNMTLTEANDRMKTDGKPFIAISFRPYLRYYRGPVPAVTSKIEDEEKEEIRTWFKYCSAAVEVKRKGAVQFVELQV